VALYKFNEGIDPPEVGGIEIKKYNGTHWNTVLFYDPPIPSGVNLYSSPYRFGQTITTNQSLIFVTTGINDIHALYYNGTHVVKVGYINSSDINIGTCDQSGSCNPAPMVISGNRLFVPGSQVRWYDIHIACTEQGYYLSDQNLCEDIDECNGTSLCNPLRECINEIGGFRCGDCPPGYSNDGLYDCIDNNECNLGTDQCSKNPLRSCQNNNGSYTCGPCPAMYRENGEYACTSIDYCVEDTHNCSRSPERQCLPLDPGYLCDDCPTPDYVNNGPYGCTAVGPATTITSNTGSGTATSGPTNTGTGTATGTGATATGTGTGSGNTNTGSGSASVSTSQNTGNGAIQNVFNVIIVAVLFLLN